MSLLALLSALLAQHAWPVKGRQPLMALYGRLALSAAKRLNAGDRNSGLLAWFALMAVVLVPMLLATVAAARLHGVLLFALDVAVLYATLRFLATTARVAGIERALREGDVSGAANRLAEWQGSPVAAEEPTAVARLAAEQGLREAHQGCFAPLFWFLVLPGPVGLVLYPLAQRAARTWAMVEPEERDFGWFAQRAFHAIDWIPQRVTAFVFAVVGNFEDALYCWRMQAAGWPQPDEGIVLAAGAGALGVRLGEPVPAGDGTFVVRPALGQGELAREDALASLEGLLWRALVLWLVVFLLAAALQIA